MKQYWRYRCWDWILCVLVSAGLSRNVLSGFELEESVIRIPVLFLSAGVVLLFCLLAAVSRKTAAAGITAALAGVTALIVYCRKTGILIHDRENSVQIFYIVIIVVSLAVFLLCRTAAGTAVLFLAGNMVQAGAAFLQFPCSLRAYVLFLAGMGMMMFYRVYVNAVLHAHTGKIRFAGFMIQNVSVCLASMLLASGIFVGIIRPLDPPVHDLKLIQKLMSFEVLEKIGVSSVLEQVDKDKLSDDTPEDRLATDQLKDEEDAEAESEKSGAFMGNGRGILAGNFLDSAADRVEEAKAIAYHAINYWYLYLLAAVILVFLAVLLKRLQRKKWLDQINGLTKEEAVLNLYAFFLYGLSKAGCIRESGLTLNEFRTVKTEKLNRFSQEPADFEQLTNIYQKVYYGRQKITEEEYRKFQIYYSGFHKNICREAGKLRYLILYFQL